MKRISPIVGARIWEPTKFFKKVKRLSQSQNKNIANKFRKIAENQAYLWSKDKSYALDKENTSSRYWKKNYQGKTAQEMWANIKDDD